MLIGWGAVSDVGSQTANDAVVVNGPVADQCLVEDT